MENGSKERDWMMVRISRIPSLSNDPNNRRNKIENWTL
jgi:hypothetical protein